MVLAVASLGGLLAFLYPFVIPGIAQVTDDAQAHTESAPLLFAGVTIVSLLATLVTISDDQAGAGRSRTVALLGVLVALDATVRLVPSIAGASPVFLLIMLVGAVFGPLMGFQMGALGVLMAGDTGGATLGLGFLPVSELGEAGLWVAAALTLLTGWDYMQAGLHHAGAQDRAVAPLVPKP